MINPIIPLAISMSEGRRTFAYFLGAGISAAAGIPTGRAIFWKAVADLYTMIHNEPPASEDQLGAWFEAPEFRDLTYSSILEQLRPSLEERRQYLEKFFIGKQPTSAHRAIAVQVKRGLVTVIVTTNFDRLMEKTLDDEGVSYDVVAAPEDLAQVRPREHSPCRILKLHGDYQRLNLRNIERELERLDEPLATEFQEILDRYGLIVIGYSGTDKDFRYHLEARRSRYGLYWVAKGGVSEWVTRLIQQQDGRVVESDSADDFLSELAAKIGVFQTVPRGETPEMVIRQTEEHLRTGDLVGLRRDIDRYTVSMRGMLYDANMNYWGIEHGERPILDEIKMAMQPLCAVGYALIKHRRWEELDHCLAAIQVLLDVSKLRPQQFSGKTVELPFLVAYNLIMLWSMYGLMTDAFPALRRLMLRQWRISTGDPGYPSETHPMWEVPALFQRPAIFKGEPAENFEHMLKVARACQFMWDDLVVTDDDLRGLALICDLFLSFLAVARSKKAYWYPHFGRMFEWRQRDLIRRLHRDEDFARGVAAIFDGIPAEFGSRWNERMKSCAQWLQRDWNLHTFLVWETGRDEE